MNIFITGAKGFVGKNLIAHLTYNYPDYTLLQCDLDTTANDLDTYCKEADVVVHLAGVNRPETEAEFQTGNAGFTDDVLQLLAKHGNKAPVILSSSIQAERDNPYGNSKRAAEKLVRDFGKKHGNPVYIYRFTNLFGKWCRPNYNSVVATFCHNIAHGLPITVNDPSVVLTLSYIDDVVEELTRAIAGSPTTSTNKADSAAGAADVVERQTETAGQAASVCGDMSAPEDFFCYVPVTADISLGQLAETLQSFAQMPKNLQVPQMTEPLTRKLYATYLSYLPVESFKYDLKMNTDHRGSFTEIIRTADRGQFSVNISKPGITKGQHWHHTKNEKFLVVSGHGRIQLRRIDAFGVAADAADPASAGSCGDHDAPVGHTAPAGSCGGPDAGKIITFDVSGDKLEVVQMIPGYTHNIINLSDTEDLITFMWADEAFDPERPDTYFQPV